MSFKSNHEFLNAPASETARYSSSVIKKVCRDCDNDFVITTKEQEFFADKKMSLPERCKTCRASRREGKCLQEEQEKIEAARPKPVCPHGYSQEGMDYRGRKGMALRTLEEMLAKAPGLCVCCRNYSKTHGDLCGGCAR